MNAKKIRSAKSALRFTLTKPVGETKEGSKWGDTACADSELEDNYVDPYDAEDSVCLFPLRERWQVDEAKMQSMARRTGMPGMLADSSCGRISSPPPNERLFRLKAGAAGRGDGPQQKAGPPAFWFIIHPQSRFRLAWDIAAMCLLAYDFAVVPLQFFSLPRVLFMEMMEVVALAYWTFDMVMSFTTGVYLNGQLRMDMGQIAKHYARTWLPFDFLIIGPQWVLVAAGGISNNAASSVTLAKALWFIRFARHFRLMRCLKLGKQLSSVKARINSNIVLLFISISKLLAGIVFAIHVLACIWYGVGSADAAGWVFQEAIQHRSLGERYLFSFQWSMARLHPSSFGKNLTLTTVPERLLACAVGLMAVGAGGILVSSITNTMGQLQKLREQRERKLVAIREFVREHSISPQLSVRAKKFIEQAVFRKAREEREAELAVMLPQPLLMELRFEAWSPILSAGNVFFADLCHRFPRVVSALCAQALHEVAVMAGETVFCTGDVCVRAAFLMTGEFFYDHGKLQGDATREKSEECDKTRTLHLGETLSEQVLWTPWEHRGALSSRCDSMLLALATEEFGVVIKSHGERALADLVQRAEEVTDWLNTAHNEDLSDILPASFVDPPAPRMSELVLKRLSVPANPVFPGFRHSASKCLVKLVPA